MEHMMNGEWTPHMMLMCFLMTTFLVLGISSFVKYLFFSKNK
jgi:hypothetical protein